ncbi:hypothetical protein SGLAD_v1c04260 [Spiroplasma gladiatoris]|uniref:Uncharacterized protein n=1 Tax=Spiroplasma gladiatoris TaxID=2143 RepID=A0A4P7AGU4_9MOLU|nr:hypothetical protein [Spiroplasma gladiatoris]QBQ07625.1 hypothetical protein SGLAD_v1c04260 [Spiroplasma gladiatoris]
MGYKKGKNIYNKSKFYLEIASNGKATFKEYYDYLVKVFTYGDQRYKQFFYDHNLVNLDTDKLIKRDKIDLDTTYLIMNKINNIGDLDRLDEINYINKEDIVSKKK